MSRDKVTLPPFPPEYRGSGLLLHVTSLPSPYGIGDVGPAALSWIDRLHDAGQSWWQALPLGPTGYGNSPYQSLSSFAGSGLLISPDWLIEDELLRASDCQVRSSPQNEIHYNAVIPFKHGLLKTAWANFSAGAPLTIPLLTLSGGVLTGSDTLNVSGQLTWTDGTMSGSGVFRFKGQGP